MFLVLEALEATDTKPLPSRTSGVGVVFDERDTLVLEALEATDTNTARRCYDMCKQLQLIFWNILI
jgi:hypothetical protein